MFSKKKTLSHFLFMDQFTFFSVNFAPSAAISVSLVVLSWHAQLFYQEITLSTTVNLPSSTDFTAQG